MTGNNSKLDFVNVDVHTKFGLIFFFNIIMFKILSGN